MDTVSDAASSAWIVNPAHAALPFSHFTVHCEFVAQVKFASLHTFSPPVHVSEHGRDPILVQVRLLSKHGAKGVQVRDQKAAHGMEQAQNTQHHNATARNPALRCASRAARARHRDLSPPLCPPPEQERRDRPTRRNDRSRGVLPPATSNFSRGRRFRQPMCNEVFKGSEE